jgi:hypothetical protein
MTNFELFQKLMKSPELSLLMRGGALSVSVILRFQYYRTYKGFLEEGHSKTTAIQLTADEYDLKSITTVYNAKNFFEKEIE